MSGNRFSVVLPSYRQKMRYRPFSRLIKTLLKKCFDNQIIAKSVPLPKTVDTGQNLEMAIGEKIPLLKQKVGKKSHFFLTASRVSVKGVFVCVTTQNTSKHIMSSILSERIDLVKPDDPEYKVVLQIFGNKGKKFVKNGSWVVYYKHLIDYVIENPSHSTIINYMLDKMDTNNIINTSIKKIAEDLDCDYSSTRRKISELKQLRIIKTNKKEIMFSPYYAIKISIFDNAEIFKAWSTYNENKDFWQSE